MIDEVDGYSIAANTKNGDATSLSTFSGHLRFVFVLIFDQNL